MSQDVFDGMPREVLLRVAKLRESVRNVYIALYSLGEANSTDVAKVTGQARAYVNMRLLQLVDLGLAKEIQKVGRQKRWVATK